MANQPLKDSLQISYGATSSSHSSSTNEARSSTLTFCVHGNKFGIATCCDDLTANGETEISSIQPPNIPLSGSSENLDHCHRERVIGIDKKALRKLMIAAGPCLLFIIIESIGTKYSDSLAIATDVAHPLADFASFMVVFYTIINFILLILGIKCLPRTHTLFYSCHRRFCPKSRSFHRSHHHLLHR